MWGIGATSLETEGSPSHGGTTNSGDVAPMPHLLHEVTMAAKRNRRRIAGIGWVTPKKGWCWTMSGKGVRKHPLPEWGSRKYGPPSIASQHWED